MESISRLAFRLFSVASGWQGIIAQLIQFVLCVIIYIPFMRLQDKAALAEEKNLQTQAAVVE